MDPFRQPDKYKRVYTDNVDPRDAREMGREAKAKGRPVYANPFVGIAAESWRKGWKETRVVDTKAKSRVY